MRDLNLESNPDYIVTLRQGLANQPLNKGMVSAMPSGLKKVITMKVSWNPGSIGAQLVTDAIFPMAGALQGDVVVLGIPATSAHFFHVIYQAWGWDTGQVIIRAFNPTAVTQDADEGVFTFTILKV